jgi:hypothetical protein
MRLYHFTCHLWWRYIQAEGISRGEAPINEHSAYCYPNLTDNPDPIGQAWMGDGRESNKRAIRISLDIPEGDEKLISWREYTKLHGMSRVAYRGYDESGGWQARHWWIYRGLITPDRFTSAEILGDPTELESEVIQIADRSASYSDFLDRIGSTCPYDRSRLGELFSHGRQLRGRRKTAKT